MPARSLSLTGMPFDMMVESNLRTEKTKRINPDKTG